MQTLTGRTFCPSDLFLWRCPLVPTAIGETLALVLVSPKETHRGYMTHETMTADAVQSDEMTV